MIKDFIFDDIKEIAIFFARKKNSMENSNFSGFLCPPACDSQNESLYNIEER